VQEGRLAARAWQELREEGARQQRRRSLTPELTTGRRITISLLFPKHHPPPPHNTPLRLSSRLRSIDDEAFYTHSLHPSIPPEKFPRTEPMAAVRKPITRSLVKHSTAATIEPH